MARAATSSRLPDEVPARAVLFLAGGHEGALGVALNAVRQAGFSCHSPLEHVWAIPFQAAQAGELYQAIGTPLSESDRRSVRCRLLPEGQAPTPAVLMQSHSLARFLEWVSGQWIAELLAAGRLITYFQPIVHCVSPSQVFAYECLTRGNQPDGRLIPPDRMYEAARATGRLVQLDAAARRKAVATVAARQLATHTFININPRSIVDPADCVEEMLRATLDAQLASNRFVFEVVESDEIVDSDQLLRLLAYFREAGFRVALDDLGAGYSSLNLLATIQPDFVKIDMGLIRGVDHDRYKAHVASKLLELARELGVRTVVEGVETRAEWQWSRDHGADFAQGYYFARPQAEPPMVALPAPPVTNVAAITETAAFPVSALLPP